MEPLKIRGQESKPIKREGAEKYEIIHEEISKKSKEENDIEDILFGARSAMARGARKNATGFFSAEFKKNCKKAYLAFARKWRK